MSQQNREGRHPGNQPRTPIEGTGQALSRQPDRILAHASNKRKPLHLVRRHRRAFQVSNRSRNLSPCTVEKYHSHLCIFESWVDSEYGPDATITLQVIREFVNSRFEKGDRPATVRSFTQVLKTFFNFLVAEGIIRDQDNPARLLKNPRVPLPEIAPLTREEIVNLLATFDKANPREFRDYVACLLMLDTGLRVGEVSRLKVADLDFERSRISVRGKGDKPRFAYFARHMAGVLRDYLDNVHPHLPIRWRHKTGRPLFPSTSNRAIGTAIGRRSLTTMIREKMDQVGIPRCHSSAHRLRHTFAVNFLRNDGGLLQLQRILGHSSLTMTRRYVMFSEEDIATAHARASPVDRLGL